MELTVREAFRSMVVFLEGYYDETHSDDVGALLGDMLFHEDGTTFDPAAWLKWIDAVRKVKNESLGQNKS